MIAYKLFRVRKDGTLGSLFINRRARIPIGVWMTAQPYKTKGFAFRPYWHATHAPEAPHLGMKGRVWCEVEILSYTEQQRPANQGGKWFLAKLLKVNRIL